MHERIQADVARPVGDESHWDGSPDGNRPRVPASHPLGPQEGEAPADPAAEAREDERAPHSVGELGHTAPRLSHQPGALRKGATSGKDRQKKTKEQGPGPRGGKRQAESRGAGGGGDGRVGPTLPPHWAPSSSQLKA